MMVLGYDDELKNGKRSSLINGCKTKYQTTPTLLTFIAVLINAVLICAVLLKSHDMIEGLFAPSNDTRELGTIRLSKATKLGQAGIFTYFLFMDILVLV